MTGSGPPGDEPGAAPAAGGPAEREPPPGAGRGPWARTGLRRGALAGLAVAAAIGGGFAWRGEPASGPARQAAPDTGPSAEAVAEGAWLFQVKGCATCHTAQVRNFPDLSGADEWAAERRHGMSAEEYLTESILDPAAAISPQLPPGSPLSMPRLNVTDEEVDALVAYLLGD